MPSWCDDHEVVLASGRRAGKGRADVVDNRHRSAVATYGDLTFEVIGYIDPEPLSEAWPRVFIEAQSRHGVIEKSLSLFAGALTVSEVRWLARQLIRAAELLESEEAR